MPEGVLLCEHFSYKIYQETIYSCLGVRSKSLLWAGCSNSIGKKRFSGSFLRADRQRQMDLEQNELEREETFILWALHNAREEQDLVEQAIALKKQHNRKFQSTLAQHWTVIEKKKQLIKNIKGNISLIDQDIRFYEQNTADLELLIKKKQREADQHIRKCVLVGETGSKDNSEKPAIEKDFGIKCRFIPQTKETPKLFEVVEKGDLLTIRKRIPETGFSKLVSQYPIPSQGRYFYRLSISSRKEPYLQIGLTTKILQQNGEPYAHSLFFDSREKVFQMGDTILKELNSFIEDESELYLIVDSGKKLLLLVIDNYLTGHVSFGCLPGDSSYYLFVGLEDCCSTLTFHH